MPIREMNAALSDDLLEVIFGIGDEIALEDPDTEPGIATGALPTDDEEFAVPPADES